MIGNTLEPGVVSSVESAATMSVGDQSAGTAVIVGGADIGTEQPTQGNANYNEVYGVADITEARSLFGEDSHLTRNISDALGQGAVPVLAIAPMEMNHTQDITDLASQEGQLDNPAKVIPEGASEGDITVTIDSDTKTVNYTLDELADETVPSGEVYINPASDYFKVDAAPSSSGTIEYTGLDYQTALQTLLDFEGDMDFLATLKARSDVTTTLNGILNQLEQQRKLLLGLAGLEEPFNTTGDIVVSYDTSRLQLLAPSYHKDYTSSIGAYAGLRANIGLSTTPINQRISLRERLHRRLDETERGALISANVTPLESIGSSARVVDDLTTVSESNSTEQNFRYGFSRLAVDFVLDALHALEQPFIGKFNSPGAIGQMQDLLNEEARPLAESNIVYEYNAEVSMVDPTTVKVLFQADVAEPIRTIKNQAVIGNNLSLQNDA